MGLPIISHLRVRIALPPLHILQIVAALRFLPRLSGYYSGFDTVVGVHAGVRSVLLRGTAYLEESAVVLATGQAQLHYVQDLFKLKCNHSI